MIVFFVAAEELSEEAALWEVVGVALRNTLRNRVLSLWFEVLLVLGLAMLVVTVGFS